MTESNNSKFARGAWSEEEHLRFLDAMERFPKGPWKAIAELVGSRSVRQVQTHAQQHHEKIARQLLGFRRDKVAGKTEANNVAATPLGDNKDIVARWRELEATRTIDGVLAPALAAPASSSPSSSRSSLSSYLEDDGDDGDDSNELLSSFVSN